MPPPLNETLIIIDDCADNCTWSCVFGGWTCTNTKLTWSVGGDGVLFNKYTSTSPSELPIKTTFK